MQLERVARRTRKTRKPADSVRLQNIRRRSTADDELLVTERVNEATQTRAGSGADESQKEEEEVMNVQKTVELTQAVAVIVDVPKTYLVVKGPRPWSGVYVAGKLPDGQVDPARNYGVVHNGNFSSEMIRVLEEQGHTFVETSEAPPHGLNLVGEGVVPPYEPEMLDEKWEERTNKVPGGPPDPFKKSPAVVAVVPVVTVKP
jgi:hypothetical protein